MSISPFNSEPAPEAGPLVPPPAASPPEPLRKSALNDLGSHMRFWLVAVLGLTLDLSSKSWAFQTLGQGSAPRTVVPHMLELQTLFNPGALFGIGSGRTSLFVVASLFALALVLWMFAQCSPRRRLLHVALGAILAGAIGNMYDRVVVQLVQTPAMRAPDGRQVKHFAAETSADGRTVLVEYPPHEGSLRRVLSIEDARRLPAPVGYVRDFLKIPTRWFGGREVWPWVFNIADMLLVGGVLILATFLWFERKEQPHKELEPESGAAPPGEPARSPTEAPPA